MAYTRKHRCPARRPHVDVIDKFAPILMSWDCPDMHADVHANRKHWQMVNAWRPLKTVRKNPVTVADTASTLAWKDYLTVPQPEVGPGVEGFWLQRPQDADRRHDWWYMADQTPEEVLLFLQHDSEGAQVVAHTSFTQPGPVPKEPRESIEVRLFLWEDLLFTPPAPVSQLDQLWEESLCPEYTIRRVARATRDTPQPFRFVPLDDRIDVYAEIDPAREEREQRARSAVIQARNKADLESRISQLQTLCNSNSRFFRMPKEVRDMIYDFILLDMPRQEFIDLELANTRYSRWKSSRLRRLLKVCRLFKDELLSRFLGLNIVRMSLYASDFSDKLGIRRGAKIVASAHVFMAFLERVRRFALHHEGSDRPFWKDTTAKTGLLLASSMPQLQELTIYPTEETTHLDGDFLFFVLQVLTSPSLNKLIFFDTFDVVEEGDFEWARNKESTCRIEVACLRPDKREPRTGRCGPFIAFAGPPRYGGWRTREEPGINDIWPWRERCLSMMGIQFNTQPSLTENNRVKFAID
ncbi:hypothetical protein GQ607_004703 [Colletotrichum asianum]|uniref:Uncharacterized protein n=1 Tax=Colletotrichum asianum TaxID=702518 RepID=A0A8H3WNZ0_9PEZI|nr:hypothetical protein GQ607_004703 [Colletotrichum asianum]